MKLEIDYSGWSKSVTTAEIEGIFVNRWKEFKSGAIDSVEDNCVGVAEDDGRTSLGCLGYYRTKSGKVEVILAWGDGKVVAEKEGYYVVDPEEIGTYYDFLEVVAKVM